MKVVQINKVKVNIFEEQELKEKLQRTTEEIDLILKYQRMFPELLQDCDGFPIDARKLHEKIVANVKEDKNGVKKKGDLFSQWIKRRIDKCNFVENKDFISVHENVNAEFTQEEIGEMTSQKRSALGITTEYNISLDMAKHLAMLENNVIGQEVRNYFILMEKTLRDYEKWIGVRVPERQNANIMRSKIAEWCDRNEYDKTTEKMYTREFNAINEAVTGNDALGIRIKLGYKDKQTREHLETRKNYAIDKMQEINITLLELNMSFEDRKKFIETKCNEEFSDLKF